MIVTLSWFGKVDVGLMKMMILALFCWRESESSNAFVMHLKFSPNCNEGVATTFFQAMLEIK